MDHKNALVNALRWLYVALLLACGPAYAASDSFNGSAGTVIDTHDPNWDNVDGSGAPQRDGSGGLREPTAGRESHWLYSTASDDSSWVRIAAPTSVAANSMLGAANIRMSGSDFGYQAVVNQGLNELLLQSSTGGNLSIQSLSPTINTSSDVIVGVEFGSFSGGNNLRFTVKQGATTQQFLYNDGTPKSAGSPGLYAVAPDAVGNVTGVLEWSTTELTFGGGGLVVNPISGRGGAAAAPTVH